jgi:hypothetical protein
VVSVAVEIDSLRSHPKNIINNVVVIYDFFFIIERIMVNLLLTVFFFLQYDVDLDLTIAVVHSW